jgi:hypothetical protein
VLARWLTVALVFGTVALAPSRGHAEQRPEHERIDFTAYTLRQNELSLGIGTAAYGLLDEVTLGTYVPTWFAFPWLDAPIATGFLKVRDWFFGPVSLALRGTFVYLHASALSSSLSRNRATRVGFFVVPVELSLSMRLHARVSESMQLSWVHVGFGGTSPSDATVATGLGAASAMTTVSLSSLTELRLSRVVALTLRGTLLLGHSDLVVRAELERNGTRVDADLGAVSFGRLVANVIPGVAFSWSHVNLHLGVGVGSNWLPIAALPIPTSATIVPDVDFYVRF